MASQKTCNPKRGLTRIYAMGIATLFFVGVETAAADSSSAATCNGAFMFAGGSGTTSDPYQVATADQLCLVDNFLSSNFIQTADIDLSAYGKWPIIAYGDHFRGSYDGGGRKITNLTIINKSQYAQPDVGLFYSIIGTVKNLSIAGNVSGVRKAGILAGSISGNNTNISNVNVSGTVNGGPGFGTGGLQVSTVQLSRPAKWT